MLTIFFLLKPATENYLGYCSETGSYIDEQQKIAIGIQYILNTYPPIIEYYETQDGSVSALEKDGNSVRHRPPNPIHYESIEQFRSINKNCCSLSDTGKKGYTPPWYQKLTGRFNTFVHIPYLVRYRDNNNNVIVSETEAFVALTNCGKPWSGI